MSHGTAGTTPRVRTIRHPGELGTLVGHFGLLFLTLWLYALAVCLAVTGVAVMAGLLPSFVLIGLFIVLGNTTCGGAIPRPLLNGFFATLSPLLPQGAALSVLRSVQYFSDRGAGSGLACLVIWAAAGLALLSAAGLREMRSRPAQSGSVRLNAPVAAGA